MNNKYRNYKYFAILDLLCLSFSFVIIFFFRNGNIRFYHIGIYRDMFFVIIAINMMSTLFCNPYEDVLKKNRYKEALSTISFDILCFVLSVLYLFVVKASGEYSRITLFLTYIVYFAISYICRMLLKKHIRKKARKSTDKGSISLLLICKEDDAKKTIKDIYNNNYDYYYISGVCIVDKDDIGKEIGNHKVVANADSLLSYVSTNWIDDIFIACDYRAIPNKIIEGLKSTGITLHIKLEEIPFLNDKKQVINSIGNYNVITSKNVEYAYGERIIKKTMDIIGGAVGCVITLLLIIILGPIIYIKSPGNIFYVSDRVGKNGKIFKFYKFRSMVLNADEMKSELKKDNRIKSDLMFKIENDPRIIPGIGYFIRKTSLDEFPQFFNVIKGDMSLVGTRPPTLDEWNNYDPYYRSRLSIKPGITGLWQVSGRSNITDFNEVVKLDNKYIKEWSIGLDIRILFMTVRKILFNNDDAM